MLREVGGQAFGAAKPANPDRHALRDRILGAASERQRDVVAQASFPASCRASVVPPRMRIFSWGRCVIAPHPYALPAARVRVGLDPSPSFATTSPRPAGQSVGDDRRCAARLVRTSWLPDAVAYERHAPENARWLVSLVGIGEDGAAGLGDEAKRLVGEAEIVFGGRRHLALAAGSSRARRRAWPTPVRHGDARCGGIAREKRSACSLQAIRSCTASVRRWRAMCRRRR